MALFIVISDEPQVAAAVRREFPRLHRRIQDGVWLVRGEDLSDVGWRLGLRTTRGAKRPPLTGVVVKPGGYLGNEPQEVWDDWKRWGLG